jgi:predicted homoserine dehydrogenase-like protein
VYSVADLACVTKREQCVPFGLLDKAKLLRDAKRDQIITQEMVELRSDTTLYHLRRIQDEVIPPTEVDRK